MKKSLFALALLLSLFHAHAQEAKFSLTCDEIYGRILAKKVHRNEKMNEIGSKTYSYSLIAMFTGSLPLTAGMMLVGGTLSFVGNIDPKEQKIADLQDEGSRTLERFTKKLQKKINQNITQEDIIAEVKGGLESGTFCMGFPDLYSPREVKKYVERRLSDKFAQSQE